MFSFLYLGRVDYAEALALQAKLVELRHQQRIGNTLLLLEHPPVLTLGRNAQRDNILAGDELLARRGVTLHEINRGGDVTFHGPGQLVGYPILDLRSFAPRLGAVDYVRLIEEVLMRMCAGYGILTQRIAGRTGVWTNPGGSIPEKKIAAIGVHISRGITSHGFALNVTTDLRDFELIVPCGIADKSVTSLEQEMDTARTIPTLEEAAAAAARSFGQVFGQQILALDSLDDLLTSRSEPQEFAPSPNPYTAIRSSMSQGSPAVSGEPARIQPEDTPLRIPKELEWVEGEEDTFLA